MTSISPEITVSAPPEIRTPNQRQREIQEAIKVVTELSRLAGNTLPIVPVHDVEDVSEQPGVYLLDTTRDPEGIESASFEFTRDNLSGAADSAHAAIPGKLSVERPHGASNDIMVVAKCFAKRSFGDRFGRVQRELRTMQAMSERDRLTIDPVAVVIAKTGGEDRVVLLTHYNSKLVTFDNLPWSQGLTPENTSNAVLGAHALGKFNADGFMHGDAKIKNVAQDESGRNGMIDYETSVPMDVSDPMVAATVANEDFSKFIDSLKQKGFFGLPRKRAFKTDARYALDEIVFAYMESWDGADESVVASVLETITSAIPTILPNIENDNPRLEL